MKGTIKWFNNAKGYGFILGEKGEDIFLHYTALTHYYDNDEIIIPPTEGDPVSYEITQGEKGPMAVNVSFDGRLGRNVRGTIEEWDFERGSGTVINEDGEKEFICISDFVIDFDSNRDYYDELKKSLHPGVQITYWKRLNINTVKARIVEENSTVDMRTSRGKLVENFVDYVTIGAKLCNQCLDNPAVAFTMNCLNNRLSVAQKVVECHDDFMGIYNMIQNNDEIMARGATPNLSGEFNEMFEFLTRPEYAQDIYFTILLASLGTFLERGNDDRESSHNLVRIVDNQKENEDGLPAISMITSAMWFSDYHGYQSVMPV